MGKGEKITSIETLCPLLPFPSPWLCSTLSGLFPFVLYSLSITTLPVPHRELLAAAELPVRVHLPGGMGVKQPRGLSAQQNLPTN